jgi:hypothetical protein
VRECRRFPSGSVGSEMVEHRSRSERSASAGEAAPLCLNPASGSSKKHKKYIHKYMCSVTTTLHDVVMFNKLDNILKFIIIIILWTRYCLHAGNFHYFHHLIKSIKKSCTRKLRSTFNLTLKKNIGRE